MYEEIPSSELRPEHLPRPDADWADIREFALTFDGYDHVHATHPGCDGTDACSELAEDVWRAVARGDATVAEFSLDDLRAALFWWQRVVRWSSTEVPGEEMLGHCHALIECMRGRLKDGERV